jgi:hypothetical protein
MIGGRASIGTDISIFLLQYWGLCSYICVFIIHLEELLPRTSQGRRAYLFLENLPARNGGSDLNLVFMLGNFYINASLQLWVGSSVLFLVLICGLETARRME